MANTMSLSGILVEMKDVAASMAMNSVAFAVGTVLGPPIGGILVAFCGWEYCFFINVVIGGLSIGLCLAYLPTTPVFKEDMLDWFGGVIILAGLISLVLGMTVVPPQNNQEVLAGIMLALGVILIVLFVVWELYHPFAILPHSILKDYKIALSLLSGLFNFALITPISF